MEAFSSRLMFYLPVPTREMRRIFEKMRRIFEKNQRRITEILRILEENQRRITEILRRLEDEQRRKKQAEYMTRLIELQETQNVGGLKKGFGRERLKLLNLIAFGPSDDWDGCLNPFGLVQSAPRDSARKGGGSSGCFCCSSGSSGFVPGKQRTTNRASATRGSGYSQSSSGSSGGVPVGYRGTHGAGGGSNQDGLSWRSGLRSRPGGTGTAHGGSSGCSCGSSRSSGSAPGKERGTDGAGGGSEKTPNGHSGSSGNADFPGPPGMLPSIHGTGRTDDLLAHAFVKTECVGTRQQICTVHLEVGHRDSFDSSSMVSGDWSRWKEVPRLKEDEGRSPVMEARLMPFGRERCCWKVDHDTSIVQAIDLKSVDQGRTVSISWKLRNEEPGRMTDFQCAVEMCQHRRGQDGATETTEPTKFPLTLLARDLLSPNAPAGNNDESPVYREGIPPVGQHEANVASLVEMVNQFKAIQDENGLRLLRIENFMEKFSQVQPSSED